jgi:hypothetical protein
MFSWCSLQIKAVLLGKEAEWYRNSGPPTRQKSGLSPTGYRIFLSVWLGAGFVLGKKKGAEKGGTAPTNKYHHKEDGGVKIKARESCN